VTADETPNRALQAAWEERSSSVGDLEESLFFRSKCVGQSSSLFWSLGCGKHCVVQSPKRCCGLRRSSSERQNLISLGVPGSDFSVMSL